MLIIVSKAITLVQVVMLVCLVLPTVKSVHQQIHVKHVNKIITSQVQIASKIVLLTLMLIYQDTASNVHLPALHVPPTATVNHVQLDIPYKMENVLMKQIQIQIVWIIVQLAIHQVLVSFVI